MQIGLIGVTTRDTAALTIAANVHRDGLRKARVRRVFFLERATAMAEARVAVQHAGLAARNPANLDAMKLHAGHVINAVDPTPNDSRARRVASTVPLARMTLQPGATGICWRLPAMLMSRETTRLPLQLMSVRVSLPVLLRSAVTAMGSPLAGAFWPRPVILPKGSHKQ